MNLEKSIDFLTLPRTVGTHPETKKEIIASIGPYGPYLKHDNKFISLKEDDVTEIGINRAVELIDKKILETKEELIGIHPETKNKIIKKKGIKGRSDYISHNKKNYPLPKEFEGKTMSVEDAIKIINEKKSTKKREINLFNIIEEEIKQNSIRQGFSKNLIKYTKKIIKKKPTNIRISQIYLL